MGTMSQFGKCNSNRFKVVIRKAIEFIILVTFYVVT